MPKDQKKKKKSEAELAWLLHERERLEVRRLHNHFKMRRAAQELERKRRPTYIS